MKRFDDPTQVPCVAVGEVFAIALAGNPTTGYTWQPSADAHYVEFVDQAFELGPAGARAGAGGQEIFRFRAVKAGKTAIDFEYRRAWSGEIRQTKRFQVTIA